MMILSSSKMALVKKLSEEPTLDRLVQEYFTDVDIVLAEGFKKENKPKITVFKSSLSDELVCPKNEILAMVDDHSSAGPTPRYDIDDILGLVDFIEGKFLHSLKTSRQHSI